VAGPGEWLLSLTVAVISFAVPAPGQTAETGGRALTAGVPFVACELDGQAGPVPAPTEPDRAVLVDEVLAQKLAYYKAAIARGVLAPRGWSYPEPADVENAIAA
jgi:hypothetical protein